MSFDYKKVKECVMNCDYKKIKESVMSCDFKKIKASVMGFDYKKVKYELNVGTMDQKIRYGVGALLLLISLFKGKIILLLLGIALIASAYTKWCPAYSGLGTSSCGKDTAASEANNEDNTNDDQA